MLRLPVCHFHDIWEFCLLIKMLEREIETVCPCMCFHSYATVLHVCIFSWKVCVCVCFWTLFVIFLSSVINVVFYWLPCSRCPQFRNYGHTKHTQCKERMRNRKSWPDAEKNTLTHSTASIIKQKRTKNDYWIPRQLQLRQIAISNGHVVKIDYRGEMAMKLKNNSNQRTKKKSWNKRGPVKRQRKERKGIDSRGAERVIGSYWHSDWLLMNGPIHLMPLGKWVGARASQVTLWSGRERFQLWYKSLR